MEPLKLLIYCPHELQRKVHASTARYRVFVAGRQVGKSTMCNMEMLKRAWERPGTRYAFISPIFSQAKEQYRRQMKTVPREVILKSHDSELRIELINGSVMEYLSGDNPHSLRGKTLDGVLIDEVRDHSPDLWGQVVRPMITTTKGWAIFSSTPAGFDGFYDMAEKYKTDKEWETFHGASTCNPAFTHAELLAAQAVMSEAEFAQEIMAEFRDLTTGKVYVNHGEWNQRTTSPFCISGGLISPYLPIIVGMDFNVGHLRWTLGQERNHDYYWFDSITLDNTHTQEASAELVDRLRACAPEHRAGIVLLGDATGKANKTSASGATDYSIVTAALGAAGFSVANATPEANPPVKDRVNVVNGRLKAADGSVHFWYHPKNCAALKRDLDRVVWKPGAHATIDQSKDPSLSHASDSVGYPVHAISGSLFTGGAGLLRLVKR